MLQKTKTIKTNLKSVETEAIPVEKHAAQPTVAKPVEKQPEKIVPKNTLSYASAALKPKPTTQQQAPPPAPANFQKGKNSKAQLVFSTSNVRRRN